MRGLLFCSVDHNIKKYCVRIDGKKWHLTITTNEHDRLSVNTEGCDKSCIKEEKIPDVIIERVKKFVRRAQNPMSRARAQLRTHTL